MGKNKALPLSRNEASFSFNDELFITQFLELKESMSEEPDEIIWSKVSEQLAMVCPNISFAFLCPEVSNEFMLIDEKALRLKYSFQRLGFTAVALAFVAFSLAVIEPIYIIPAVEADKLPSYFSSLVAVIAALSGLASVVIGVLGAGVAGRRKNWIDLRLVAEVLRQWQSQYRCTHIVEILNAVGSPNAIDCYGRKRVAAFKLFKRQFIDCIDGTRKPYVHPHTSVAFSPWLSADVEARAGEIYSTTAGLIQGGRKAERDFKETALRELFVTHDEIRFGSQINYTNVMLGHGKFSKKVKTQERLLSTAGFFTIIAACVLHALVLIAVIFQIDPLKGSIIHALAIVSALVALGVRVLEDGLQPSAHLARLRLYLGEITRHRARFRQGSDSQMKHIEMLMFEEAASRELQTFIKTISVSRYIF